MNKFLLFTAILSAFFAFTTPVNGLRSLKPLFINASAIQGHIDTFLSQASGWLQDTRNQDEIADILSRAKRIALLVDLNITRQAVHEVIDHVQENINNFSQVLNQSLTEVIFLDYHLRMSPNERYHEYEYRIYDDYRKVILPLKESYGRLRNLMEHGYLKMFQDRLREQFAHLSTADNETLSGIQRILGRALKLLWNHSTVLSKNIQRGSRILEIIDYFADEETSRDIRRRDILLELQADLKNFNISQQFSIAKSVANFIFEDLEKLRTQVIKTADEALVLHNNYTQDSSKISPGEFLDNHLRSLSDGMGERIVNSRNKIIKKLYRIVKNTLQAFRFKNIPGFNDPYFNLKFTMIYEKYTERIRRILNPFEKFWYSRTCREWSDWGMLCSRSYD